MWYCFEKLYCTLRIAADRANRPCRDDSPMRAWKCMVDVCVEHRFWMVMIRGASLNAMLFLQLLQIPLSLSQVILLFCLMIQSNKISLLEVKAIQLLACDLSIHDILVDNEAGSFGIVGGALSNLANGAVISKQVE